MGKFKGASKIALIAATTFLAYNPAMAQNSDEIQPENLSGNREIVVTATKTGAESVQDIPLAISAFDAEILADQGVLSVQDVSAVTPGFTFSSNGPWAISSIRGVGTNNVFAGGDPNTTVQVDGVYIARPSSGNLDFADVERVEILRGPQGTIYGRNAIAGTINVITKTPGSNLEVLARASVGTDNFYKFDGSISGPLIEDRLAASISASYTHQDGFIDQLVAGLPDANDKDRISVRAKLVGQISDRVKLTVSGDYYTADEAFNFDTVRVRQPFIDGQNPDFFELANDFPNLLDMERWGVSADLEVELGDFVLKSITAYRESNQLLQADLDNSGLFLAHTVAFPEDQWQFSQEITISGNIGDLELIFGGFYFKEEVDSFTNVHFPLAFAQQTAGLNAKTESISAFAQGSYAITDRLVLTAGLRYTDDQKLGTNTQGFDFLPGLNFPTDPFQFAATSVVGPERERNFNAFTPKFGIDFKVNNDVLIYGSITRGFKSGGFNLLTPTPEPVPFEEESLWAYEAGIKSDLANGNLRLNASAFYYDYTGLQVNQFFSAGLFGQAILNAPGAEIYGLELEADAYFGSHFRAGANIAYLNTKYDGSFLVPDDPNGSIFIEANGNRLNDAPKWSGNLFAEFTHPIGSAMFSTRADLSYNGTRFYTASNNPLESGNDYVVLNLGASLSFDDDKWEVGVVAKNVMDEEYINRAVTIVGITNAQPSDPFSMYGYVKFSF